MATKDALPGVLEEESAEPFIEWAQRNANTLAIAGIVVAVVLSGGLLWRASVDKKEVNASAALAQVEGVVQAGNVALAQSDLQTFLQRYGGTKAGVQARLLLARVHFSQGKVDDGLKVLDEVKSPGAFAASYHSLRAAGLEQGERPGEAALAYEAAAAADGSVSARAGHLADAARAYANAGKTAEARRLWGAMAEDDANPMSGEAKVRLGELNAKSPS